MKKNEQFNLKSTNFKINRIMHLEHILEFVKQRKLHFSPFTDFPDLMEGKTFKQAKFIDDNNAVSPDKRRKILYASCWYKGKESLNIWDNYGKKSKDMHAIQVSFNSFSNLFDKENFYFDSKTLANNKETGFKLDKLYCGLIKYIDIHNQDLIRKELIGRFKSNLFRHEKEFRFLIKQNYHNEKNINLKDLKCCFNEYAFDKIIFTIILSPYSSLDYFEFVKKAFSDQINVKVKQSIFYELFN
jgi:hypothetical protein